MLENVKGRALRGARVIVFVAGVIGILTLVIGMGTVALGGNGDFFKVGRTNEATRMSTLRRTGGGAALRLRVDAGPPMRVSSSTKVEKLNADKLDDKSVTEIGINGLQRVQVESPENSVSPKQVTASCPQGKVLTGTGFDVFGGKTGTSPDAQTHIVIDFVIPGSASVTVAGYEDTAVAGNWSVTAIAICATAP